MRSFIPVMLIVACVQTPVGDPLEFDPQDFVLDDGSILPAPGSLALEVSGGTYATPTEFKVSGAFGFEEARILRTNRGLTPEGPCFPAVGVCFSLQPPIHYLSTVHLEFDGAGARSIPTPEWVPEGTMACFQAFIYREGGDSEASNTACVYIGADDDADGIVNPLDRCEGFDDAEDEDGDGYPDGCDPCLGDPEMPGDDRDGDGICDDPCPRDADNDADGDGVCADLDPCPLDADDDIDRDGLCADVDPCPIDRDNDADGDGMCGCDPYDPTRDCDPCPSFAFGTEGVDWFDSDGDGVCDTDDGCPDDPYDGCGCYDVKVGVAGSSFAVPDLLTQLGDTDDSWEAEELPNCDADTLDDYDAIIVHGNPSGCDYGAIDAWVDGGGALIGTPWVVNNGYAGSLDALPMNAGNDGAMHSGAIALTVLDAGDPILAGLDIIDGDDVGHERANSPKVGVYISATHDSTPGGAAVASWDYGAGRAVYLDFQYYTSDCTLATDTEWGPLLMRNAISWAVCDLPRPL